MPVSFPPSDPINPMEILAKEIGTYEILALFGSAPDIADPNGKYRFFINSPEDITYVARVSYAKK